MGENSKNAIEEMDFSHTLCMMQPKKVYADFLKKMSEINLNAASELEVSEAVDKLEKLVIEALKNSQLKEISGALRDTKGTLYSLKMRDCTRSDMLKMLQLLEDRVNELILEEEKKDNIEKLRRLFKASAENAEKIAEVLNISQIFAN